MKAGASPQAPPSVKRSQGGLINRGLTLMRESRERLTPERKPTLSHITVRSETFPAQSVVCDCRPLGCWGECKVSHKVMSVRRTVDSV
jgi:hypothetical protein